MKLTEYWFNPGVLLTRISHLKSQGYKLKLKEKNGYYILKGVRK